MENRTKITSLALPAILLAPPAALHAAEAQAGALRPEGKPNVIFILSDDIGYGDLGCYGATKVKTPNLDKMAANGIRFTSGYAPSAMCTPSRYAVLTGEYAWRGAIRDAVLNGDAGLIIRPGSATWPAIMKKAGYVTGGIGKWHLGLGPKETGPDYNGEIKPGPLEVGFDFFFGYPATNDRVPTVYMENHRVVGLDPDDPIHIINGREGKTMAAGISRIGTATGGQAAWWKDDEMADVLRGKVVEFIEQHRNEPFYLYYTPRNIHYPLTPGKRFQGTSQSGLRGDDIQELDWVVGDLMATLERLNLEKNTIVIFSSDNGAARAGISAGHSPNGALRGEKSSLYEGGTRVPFIIQWPERIAPRQVSDQPVSLVDMPASFAALVGQEEMAKACPDSVNVLPALLGTSSPEPVRQTWVTDDSRSRLAMHDGDWKFIPINADGKPELYNLKTDLGEQNNVVDKFPEVRKKLEDELMKVRKQVPGGDVVFAPKWKNQKK